MNDIMCGDTVGHLAVSLLLFTFVYYKHLVDKS